MSPAVADSPAVAAGLSIPGPWFLISVGWQGRQRVIRFKAALGRSADGRMTYSPVGVELFPPGKAVPPDLVQRAHNSAMRFLDENRRIFADHDCRPVPEAEPEPDNAEGGW